jgi:uncharacterized protein (TIGR02145 family)
VVIPRVNRKQQVMKRLIVTSLMYALISFMAAGQDLETVKIGEQEWMKHNLNTFADSSYCYKNDPKNCEVFGRLYDWETAMTICPAGFRLPTDEDWTTLTETVGGLNAVLKAGTRSNKGMNGASIQARIDYMRRAMNCGLVQESSMRRAQKTIANLEGQL